MPSGPGSLTTVTIPILRGVDADDLILAISRANEGIRIEQTSPDELTLMSPSGSRTSRRNAEIISQLTVWNKKAKRGRVYDSNTLFAFPDGRKLGPDAAWISHERLSGVSEEEDETFIRRIPEFVVELMSPSDSRRELRRKMEAWRTGGVLLGWLIDPKKQSVEIYRVDGTVEYVTDRLSLIADGPLEGFSLALDEVWAA
jgi:Uma2 family endonuclease